MGQGQAVSTHTDKYTRAPLQVPPLEEGAILFSALLSLHDGPAV